jgi:predicted transcriptional regulator
MTTWAGVYASAIGLADKEVKVMGTLHSRSWKHAEQIAAQCGLSVNQVRKALMRLLKAGHVEKQGMMDRPASRLDTKNYWRLSR